MRTLAFLLTLLLSSLAWAQPNTGSGSKMGTGGTGVGQAWKDSRVWLVPSTRDCEAPCDVSFQIHFTGSQIGQSEYWLFCNDDDVNILPATGSRYPNYSTPESAILDVDGFCHYETAGTKTPQLFINFRGWLPTIAESLVVTESSGSISVDLSVSPLNSTELTDLTLTATVTGESASNVTCDFYCNDAAVVWGDGLEDGTVGPQASGTVIDAEVSCVNLTDGEYTAAVACQRNAQEAVAYAPYTISPQVTVISNFSPNVAQGTDPLNNVEFTTKFSTGCPNDGNIQILLDCDNNGVDEDDDTVAIADYIDDNGIITYTSATGGECDYTPDGAYEAEVTIVCPAPGTAATVTDTTPIQVDAAVVTFWIDTQLVPNNCVAGSCTGVAPWIYLDGNATGNVSALNVDCESDTVDDLSGGALVAPASQTWIDLSGQVTCDYASEGTFTMTVDATRDGESDTDTSASIVVDPLAIPTFYFSTLSSPSSCDAGSPECADVDISIYFAGTAAGDVTGINVDCDGDGIDECEDLTATTPARDTWLTLDTAVTGDCTCDYSSELAGTYTATVEGTSGGVDASNTHGMIVNAATTFWFSIGPYTPGMPDSTTCMENDCLDRPMWIYGIGGGATGTLTSVSLDCDTGAGGVDYSGLTLDPGSFNSVEVLQGDGSSASCSYTTAGTYPIEAIATRDGETYTANANVVVFDVVDTPIFDLSQTSFSSHNFVGDATADATFELCNRGETRMDWAETAAHESAAWLSCTPNATAANGGLGLDLDECETITCTRTTTALTEGSYQATVTYVDADASPTTATVTFDVRVDLPTGDTPIHPFVDLNLNSGPSPLAVNFSVADTGNNLGLYDTTDDTWHENATISENFFNAMLYEWDFGDDTGAVWTPTGNSRNFMTGPLAAHVYEPTSFPNCAGTCRYYYPSLRVTDQNGKIANWSATITVYDPNSTTYGWGAANKTACISTSGTFTGCTGTNVTSSDLDAAIAAQLAAGARRILFRGGETFTADIEVILSTNGPGLIGSYGTGQAIFKLRTNGHGFALTGDNWRMQNIKLGVNGVHDGTHSLLNAGVDLQNFLLYEMTGTPNVYSTYFTAATDNFGPEDYKAANDIFFVENTFSDHTDGTAKPLARYQLYVAGKSISALGNDFGLVENEHQFRSPTGEFFLTSNNFFRFTGRWSATHLNYRDLVEGCAPCDGAPSSWATYCGHETQYYLTQDNIFNCSTGGCVAGTGPSQSNYCESVVIQSRDFIFERNFFYSSNNSQNVIQIEKIGSNSRYVIRNNIIYQSASNYPSPFVISSPDLTINNNTCYISNNPLNQNAACIWQANSAKECKNNILYAPNATNDIEVIRFGSCAATGGNMSNATGGGINSLPWSPVGAYDEISDFIPKVGSDLINAGTDIPTIFDDALGNPRTGTFDAGAVEKQ